MEINDNLNRDQDDDYKMIKIEDKIENEKKKNSVNRRELAVSDSEILNKIKHDAINSNNNGTVLVSTKIFDLIHILINKNDAQRKEIVNLQEKIINLETEISSLNVFNSIKCVTNNVQGEREKCQELHEEQQPIYHNLELQQQSALFVCLILYLLLNIFVFICWHLLC